MIKIGDRVKFISDTSVGIVASIKGSVATVTIEDGFDVPALVTDLVVVESKDEEAAKIRMGVSDGTPIGAPKKPKEKQPKAPHRHVNHYGKISIADEFEDEEPMNFSSIRSNYIKNNTPKEVAPPKPQPSSIELIEYQVNLCFVPEDVNKPEESARYSMYIVNDSSYEIFYTISKWNGTAYVSPLAVARLDADSKEEIHTYRKEELATVSKLLINIILFKQTNYVPQPVESFSLDLSPMKFVKRGGYTNNDFFDSPAMVYTIASSSVENEIVIDEKELIKALREKEDIKVTPVKRNDEPEIVDLHAQEILDSTDGMTPGEIITTQLARFEIVMDLAVSNNKKARIVFIHGVGSGKLKYELKRLMTSKYPKIKYQDASFKEYGYGAIMVFV